MKKKIYQRPLVDIITLTAAGMLAASGPGANIKDPTIGGSRSARRQKWDDDEWDDDEETDE